MPDQNLLNIVSSVINRCGEVQLIQPINWEYIIHKARLHGLSHLVYKALEYISEIDKPSTELINELKVDYYRNIQKQIRILADAENILNLFESNKIYVIPMKGYNTKDRYPEEYMRSMGDLDLLTRSKQYKMIHSLLKAKGYDGFIENRKHDQYWGKSKICIEIHRSMVAENSMYSDYYKDIWQRTLKAEGKKYIFKMNAEDEYIFNIVHLIEHLRTSGITIRFILDVYIYITYVELDREYLDNEFRKLKLSKFVSFLENLANEWFSVNTTELSRNEGIDALGKYVLDYGSVKQRKMAANMHTLKGKKHYLLESIFPNYKNMISIYPWLNNKKYLLPLAWVVRGYRSIRGKRGHIKAVINRYKNANRSVQNELKDFYKTIGIDI